MSSNSSVDLAIKEKKKCFVTAGEVSRVTQFLVVMATDYEVLTCSMSVYIRCDLMLRWEIHIRGRRV